MPHHYAQITSREHFAFLATPSALADYLNNEVYESHHPIGASHGNGNCILVRYPGVCIWAGRCSCGFAVCPLQMTSVELGDNNQAGTQSIANRHYE